MKVRLDDNGNLCGCREVNLRAMVPGCPIVNVPLIAHVTADGLVEPGYARCPVPSKDGTWHRHVTDLIPQEDWRWYDPETYNPSDLPPANGFHAPLVDEDRMRRHLTGLAGAVSV